MKLPRLWTSILLASIASCNLTYHPPALRNPTDEERKIIGAAEQLDAIAYQLDEFGTVSAGAPVLIRKPARHFGFRLNLTPKQIFDRETIQASSAARGERNTQVALNLAFNRLAEAAVLDEEAVEAMNDAVGASPQVAAQKQAYANAKRMEAEKARGAAEGSLAQALVGMELDAGSGTAGADPVTPPTTDPGTTPSDPALPTDPVDPVTPPDGDEDEEPAADKVELDLGIPGTSSGVFEGGSFARVGKQDQVLERSLRDIITRTFNDHTTLRLFEWFSSPEQHQFGSNKELYAAVMNVNIRPGRRTVQNYMAEIDVQVMYASCGIPHGTEFPVAFAVFPGLDGQVLDLTNEQRRQSSISLLATAILNPRTNLDIGVDSSKRFQQDTASLDERNTVVAFNEGANHFGWRFLPRFTSQGDPSDKDPRAALELHPQTFPALVLLLADRDDLDLSVLNEGPIANSKTLVERIKVLSHGTTERDKKQRATAADLQEWVDTIAGAQGADPEEGESGEALRLGLVKKAKDTSIQLDIWGRTLLDLTEYPWGDFRKYGLQSDSAEELETAWNNQLKKASAVLARNNRALDDLQGMDADTSSSIQVLQDKVLRAAAALQSEREESGGIQSFRSGEFRAGTNCDEDGHKHTQIAFLFTPRWLRYNPAKSSSDSIWRALEEARIEKSSPRYRETQFVQMGMRLDRVYKTLRSIEPTVSPARHKGTGFYGPRIHNPSRSHLGTDTLLKRAEMLQAKALGSDFYSDIPEPLPEPIIQTGQVFQGWTNHSSLFAISGNHFEGQLLHATIGGRAAHVQVVSDHSAYIKVDPWRVEKDKDVYDVHVVTTGGVQLVGVAQFTKKIDGKRFQPFVSLLHKDLVKDDASDKIYWPESTLTFNWIAGSKPPKHGDFEIWYRVNGVGAFTPAKTTGSSPTLKDNQLSVDLGSAQFGNTFVPVEIQVRLRPSPGDEPVDVTLGKPVLIHAPEKARTVQVAGSIKVNKKEKDGKTTYTREGEVTLSAFKDNPLLKGKELKVIIKGDDKTVPGTFAVNKDGGDLERKLVIEDSHLETLHEIVNKAKKPTVVLEKANKLIVLGVTVEFEKK